MKTYILDTNVLVRISLEELLLNFTPPCLFAIPLVVVQELDTFKNSTHKRCGYTARRTIAYLEELKDELKIDKKVELSSGHFIKIASNPAIEHIPDGFDVFKADNRIIMTALELHSCGEDVTLLTQDLHMRLIARVLGLQACPFISTEDSSLYQGWKEVDISALEIENFFSSGELLNKYDLIQNEYAILTNSLDSSNKMLGKCQGDRIVRVTSHNSYIYGIKALNIQQKFLFDLLLNPAIKVVTASGWAGTGKTLLSLAAALEQTKVVGSRGVYDRIFITRAPEPTGKDLGFLPGDIAEKFRPWTGAIYDNLGFLLSKHATSKNGTCADINVAIDSLLSYGRVELQPYTYIRGRSIPNTFIIVDEAQNLSHKDAKTLVSRAGEGTKVVLIGDIEQIDNNALTTFDNGLVDAISAFRGNSIYGHVHLTEVERSELAELAAKLL